MGSTPVGISASRGAAVLGLSQFKSTVEVWLEIMEQREPGFCAARKYVAPKDEDSAATRLGLAFEGPVLELAEDQYGSQIVDREKLVSRSEYPYITAHLDGVYNATGTLHEGKTTNHRAFDASYGAPGTDRVPAYIAVQVQHQMYTAAEVKNVVSVLVFPKVQDKLEHLLDRSDKDKYAIASALAQLGFFHQYPIERNDDSIKAMLEAYDEFWNKNVLESIEPDPSNYEDVRRLFPEPKGTIIADEKHDRIAREYGDINGEINKMEKRKAEIKTELIPWAIKEGLRNGLDIDSDSVEKLQIMSADGHKLRSYNGKMFR